GLDAMRGDGKEEGDGGAEGADRDQQPEMPAEDRFVSPHLRIEMWGTRICDGALAVGAGEEASGHEGERGQRGQRVVLLAGGKGEEAEDEAGPEKQGEGGLVGAGTPHGLRRTTPAGQKPPPGGPGTP